MNIVIVGHVDHGKSTLIGRLLADTDSLPKGKLDHVRAMCERNAKPFEYAFLLDALKDEQEQGITIDMARCFFKTSKRDYIIIDAPGHIEFLKNMITGAARAEAAVLLIDAKEGVQENSKRHGFLLSMLGIKQVVVVINKMDLVGYDQAIYNQIVTEYTAFLKDINLSPKTFVPISAFEGDNLVTNSPNTPWYTDKPVLDLIDEFEDAKSEDNQAFRMPLQGVYKFTEEGDDRRIFAGTVERGTVSVGDKVVFLPSGKESKVKSIEGFNTEPASSAKVGEATGLTLDTQIYVKPGELLCKADEPQPQVGHQFKAHLFWLGKTPLVKNKRYKLKLLSTRSAVYLDHVEAVMNASDLSKDTQTQEVSRHEVAEVVFKTLKPIAFDVTQDSATTSRFVIIDDYEIAGGGIITENLSTTGDEVATGIIQARQTHWERGDISAEDRAQRMMQKPLFVLLTGPQELNRVPVAKAVEKMLFDLGKSAYYLGVTSTKDRDHHLRKMGETAHLFTSAGLIFISTIPDLDDNEARVLQEFAGADQLLIVTLGESMLHLIKPHAELSEEASIDTCVSDIKEALGTRGIFLDYSI